MFEKEPGKLGRLYKVKAIRKPLPLNKNNQAKQNKNKKIIKTEIGLTSLFWKILVEAYKKRREQPI